jgi:hypothetical protein
MPTYAELTQVIPRFDWPRIEHYPAPDKLLNRLKDMRIQKITADIGGKLWISTEVWFAAPRDPVALQSLQNYLIKALADDEFRPERKGWYMKCYSNTEAVGAIARSRGYERIKIVNVDTDVRIEPLETTFRVKIHRAIRTRIDYRVKKSDGPHETKKGTATDKKE